MMGITIDGKSNAHDSMEPLVPVRFDAFVREAGKEFPSGTSESMEPANIQWTPSSEDNAVTPNEPITTMCTTNCLSIPQSSQSSSPLVPEPKLIAVRDQADTVAKTYKLAIIEVHKASSGLTGVSYPEDLQNLLLTMSRIIEAIATHCDKAANTPASDVQLELVDTLEWDLTNCDMTCQMIREAIPRPPGSFISDEDGTKLAQTWKDFRHTYERKVCKTMLPLLVFYKHMKWLDRCQNFVQVYNVY
jgi:hypothetical protein